MCRMLRKAFQYCMYVVAVFSSFTVAAQAEHEKLTATILHLDSAFWNAYNRCDTVAFKNYFTDDVEFYHDKGGTTTTSSSVVDLMNKNLCGNNNFRLRREAVPGTIKIYPMEDNGKIYGAVISGEHLFYITANGKPEYLDGQALFTHLWLLKDGAWKMSRVLSYNHHDPNKQN